MGVEGKQVFTISEIARLFEMTVQGIHLWIRQSKLREFERTSARGKYLIPRREVVRLLRLASREVPGLWAVRRRKARRVLVIDDSAPIRKLIERAFRDAAYALRVRTAATVEEGWLLAERFWPEVIVLDDFGDAALSFIRSARCRGAMKVIGMGPDRRVGLKMIWAGANEFLLKPFGLEELKDALLRQTFGDRRVAERRRPLQGIVTEASARN